METKDKTFEIDAAGRTLTIFDDATYSFDELATHDRVLRLAYYMLERSNRYSADDVKRVIEACAEANDLDISLFD